MTKKAILAALGLITLGIVIGALLVANLSNGVESGYALSGDDVKLGGPTPIPQQYAGVKALSDNFVAVAKAVRPSVVSINVTSSGKNQQQRNMPRDFFHFWGPDFQAPEQGPQRGSGSGIVITPDGYIATNNHVVADADKDGIEVVFMDKSRYKAKLIGTDPTTDLAVVKIEAKNLTVAALGNSDNVQVGEWVLAVGNPLELTSTVTAGIVSALGRNINIINERGQGRTNYGIEDFIQTDAAINPGNSGGGLVNMNGEVIGVNTAIATTNRMYQGYGFAVPVNLLKRVASDLIKHGEVRRGYIGVTITTVDKTMAKAIGLPEAGGVLVQGTVKGGAAEAAGVKEGDVVLSVDGRQTLENNELQSYIATKRIGDVVKLKLFRDGKTIEKDVTLKPREDKPVTTAKNEGGAEETPAPTAKSLNLENLGLTVRALSSDEKKELNVGYGVLVVDVKDFGEASNRGLGKDMVILEADRKKVNSPADLKKIVEGRKAGDSILMRVQVDDETTTFMAVQIPE
jgi:serine protease Do